MTIRIPCFVSKVSAAVLLICFTSTAAASGGDLMDIRPVTDRILMIHIRDGHIDTYGTGQSVSNNKVYISRTNIGRAESLARYLISSPDDENYSSAVNPVHIGRKSKGWDYNDEWYRNDQGQLVPYVWQHWIYIELPHAMRQGSTYTVRLENITGNRSSSTFEFDVNRTRSETVRVNMVGFSENVPKFAYLSHWMGDFSTDEHADGGLNLDDRAGSEFRVIEYYTGETVFSGIISKRMDKNTRETSSTDFPSGNYTNADVWECDFSALTTPGEYVIAADGIGCSFPFEIGNAITREPFYYAMKGLFWQRQGIVKEIEPGRIMPRGHHPDDIKWLWDRDWHGQGYDVSGFDVSSPRVYGIWGHYYDAGDWDGYVSHARVPMLLLLMYELAPDQFHDGDAGNRYKFSENDTEWIEEGSNGIPDLLDEAVWLINFYRRARTILKTEYGGTGGVPGYTGRDAIPAGNNITAWMDTRDWYLSGENIEASYNYAGLAAWYAVCLNLFSRLSGTENHPDFNMWKSEAVEAWQWAESKTITTDNEKRARGFAAVNLYRVTGDDDYQSVFREYFNWEPHKDDGEWAGPNIAELAASVYSFIPENHNGLDIDFQNVCRAFILDKADRKVNDINANAFRCGMEADQFMQLGGFTTPRLTLLPVARKLTGNDEYLEALQHAVNYVLGGNQLNMTYLSGLGERSDQWIFLPNAYLTSNKNSKVYTPEIYIGMTSYFGATGLASNYWFTQSQFSEYFSRDAAWPQAKNPPSVWPGAEQKFQNRYSIQGGEFTVHQQNNYMIYAMGYIKASSGTSPVRYQPPQRPVVSLNLPDGAAFPKSGFELTVTASANTRSVKYYYDWRFIGESFDRENHFRVFWEPPVDPGDRVLLTAAATSDKGIVSRPSDLAEADIVIEQETTVEKDKVTSAIFKLNGNYPNPFNPSTFISFSLQDEDHTKLKIYNMLGKQVSVLIDKKMPAGNHVFELDASFLPSGIYLCKLQQQAKADIKKMILIK